VNRIERPRSRDEGEHPRCTGGEDWVLAVSLAFRGRIGLDPTPGLVYHRHAGSVLARARGTAEMLAAARRVRERVALDPAVPRSVKAALPLIATAQWLLIVGVRPLYTAGHRVGVSLRRGPGGRWARRSLTRP
jgi:hypothetical protein